MLFCLIGSFHISEDESNCFSRSTTKLKKVMCFPLGKEGDCLLGLGLRLFVKALETDQEIQTGKAAADTNLSLARGE